MERQEPPVKRERSRSGNRDPAETDPEDEKRMGGSREKDSRRKMVCSE